MAQWSEKPGEGVAWQEVPNIPLTPEEIEERNLYLDTYRHFFSLLRQKYEGRLVVYDYYGAVMDKGNNFVCDFVRHIGCAKIEVLPATGYKTLLIAGKMLIFEFALSRREDSVFVVEVKYKKDLGSSPIYPKIGYEKTSFDMVTLPIWTELWNLIHEHLTANFFLE